MCPGRSILPAGPRRGAGRPGPGADPLSPPPSVQPPCDKHRSGAPPPASPPRPLARLQVQAGTGSQTLKPRRLYTQEAPSGRRNRALQSTRYSGSWAARVGVADTKARQRLLNAARAESLAPRDWGAAGCLAACPSLFTRARCGEATGDVLRKAKPPNRTDNKETGAASPPSAHMHADLEVGSQAPPRRSRPHGPVLLALLSYSKSRSTTLGPKET